MKVLIPTPLRQYADRKTAVDVSGQTVEEALKALTSQHSELRKHIYGEDGRLRAFVNVYLNDEDIRYLDKEKTPVKESDTLSIVPSIAGGRD
jgi:molybdopterin converting factor small subunit